MKRPKICHTFVLGLFLLVVNSLFSQSLEDTIYTEVDALVAAPSEVKLTQLQPKITSWKSSAVAPGEHMALVILQSTMGYQYNRLSKTGAAIQHYEDAWQRFDIQKLKGYDIVEYCLKPLGNLYIKTGAFSQAENTIKSYIFLAQQEHNKAQEVGGIINLSVVYHNTGNYRTAIDLLTSGLNIGGVSDVQKNKMQNNLATNLIALQEYEKAQLLVDDALVSSTDINTLKNGAQLAIQNENYVEAEKLLNQAQQLLVNDTTATTRELAKLYVEKAQLNSAQGKNQFANVNYAKALQTLLPLLEENKLPTKAQVYAENTLLDIFDGQAALSEDRSSKISYYNLGIEVAKQLWQNLPDQQAKILHQSDQHLRYERMLEVLYEWYETDHEQENIEEAFRISAASNANVLQHSISQQNLRSQYPNDVDLQLEATLQQSQQTLINELNQKRRLGQNTQVVIDQLNRTQLRLEELQDVLSNRYPETNESPVLIGPLQRRLGQEQAQMMHYFFGRNHLYAFHISATTMEWKRERMDESFRNTLVSFIGYFDQPNLINDDPISYSEVAFNLYKLLHLDMLSEEKSLQIVPDGLLYFVPFDALQTTPSQVFEYAQMPFLTKKYNLGYQTSAVIYRDAHTELKEAHTLGMFPVFEATDRSLLYSLEEANFVEESLPTTLFKNKEATEANFLANANKHNILHISTHASGGDFIVPAHIEFIDQTLELPELYALSMSPQLVVLSACETGVGKVQKGEGAMSLARGFQYAGSKNILFTLWQVNDQTTARWMQLFYQRLATNGNAYESQYDAKLAYLADTDISNAKKSPYYWSAFTYYGATEPLFTPSTSNWVWIAISGVLLLLLLFLIFKLRKTKQPSS